MQYEYSSAKKASNLKKHGLNFDDAKQIIESTQTVTLEDNRYDYGEVRYIMLGLLNSDVVVIVMTETKPTIRIISMI